MLGIIKSRSFLIQVAVLLSVVAVVAIIMVTTVQNLEARGIPLGYDFLWFRAGLTIPESFLPYSPDNIYAWAIVVGIGNTIGISIIVAVLCTVIGCVLGIARLSTNPMIRGFARIWIETARNTPPVLMLIFLYSMWWKVMPPVSDAWEPLPGIFLSIRGMALPKLSLTDSAHWLLITLALAMVAVWVAQWAVKRAETVRGKSPKYTSYAVGMSLVVLLVGMPTYFNVEWPRLARTNFVDGFTVTPEFVTIVVGLTYYTAGFVAEIVRAGILSVPKGQWEAARALGLKERRILSLIIIPQTLRVIVPPMTSQYINLVKNSTLAIAVGFPDFMVTMTTIINRTSHAFEGIAIIVVVYLMINLSLSLLFNAYNRRLKQR